ncbi:MAG: hypothetical protein Q7T73_16050 [Beijerinckiaceae bacterium]|nr:hypothetical protein [Beijerinckiaceae bacterium]
MQARQTVLKPAGEPHPASALRADIDSGRTGDKIDHSDPAAAPLGTDDEAGGAPPSAAAMSRARQYETTRAAPHVEPQGRGRWVYAIVIACVIVILAAFAAVQGS